MKSYPLTSPDGRLTLLLTSEEDRLFYSVTKNDTVVIELSPIGAMLDGADLTSGVQIVDAQYGEIDDAYSLPAFKKSVCRDRCKTLTLRLEKEGYPFGIEARAYDDGAAVRFVFEKEDVLLREVFGFGIPESAYSVYGMKFRFTYEDEFYRIPFEDLHQNLWIFPMLIESGKGVWGLITEAGVYGEYGGRIVSSEKDAPRMLYVTDAPDEFEELKTPVSSAWRVILAGTLDEIVNSNTIENLNPPCEYEDTSWIEGGLAGWSCMTDSVGTYEREKEFIDYCGEMGWPYYTVDGGWDVRGWDIPALVDYAAARGVKLWLWAHRRSLTDPVEAEEKIKLWASWGIAGLKIDFFESDSRERTRLYDMLSRLTAKYHLMVNYHGASKNTGEIRRWPHVISREGVMGGENYQNYATEYFVQTTARHNVMLVYTRNVVGPMDYTPTTYETYRTGSTDCHQTALPVVFTSYITHIMENPEVIRRHPASEFLRNLPVTWDESILLEGQPDVYATMARRKGGDWWIAGINARVSRIATVDLSFLDDGEYRATLYQDGMEDLHAVDVPIGAMERTPKEWYPQWDGGSRPTSHQHNLDLVDISHFTASKQTRLEIPCVQDGGFCLKLEKLAKTETRR